jgi:hypothetical protein
MQAHAQLDQADGTNHGWTTRATRLRDSLILDGLDPDPLTTIENETDTEAEGRNPPGL